MREYVLNKETQKIELQGMPKDDYMSLSSEDKSKIKSAFQFSRYAGCWVSRSKNNHYRAIETAKALNFIDGGSTGERLTYAEEQETKQDKAERRADRMETHATNATKRAEGMQSEANSFHGDISFWTQPNINSSGGRSFTNYRKRIMDRYAKGFDEYRKSDYFMERAENARTTASNDKIGDPVYIANKIKEQNKTIKKLETRIIKQEDGLYKVEAGEVMKNYNGEILTADRMKNGLSELLELIHYEIDKMAYFENAMDAIKETQKIYSREDIKPGYLIKARFGWSKVTKANPLTVYGEHLNKALIGMASQTTYEGITDVKIPEGWTDTSKKAAEPNPFNTGDLFVKTGTGSDHIHYAYQVIKTTAKMVTIRKISIEDNKPVKNNFIGEAMRKKTQKYSGVDCLYDRDWRLTHYTGATA